MDDLQAYTKTLRALDEEVRTLEEYILDGALTTELDYFKAVARRQGLLAARGIFVETLGRAIEED